MLPGNSSVIWIVITKDSFSTEKDLSQRHGKKDEKNEESVQKPVEDVEEVEVGGTLDYQTEAMVYEDVSEVNVDEEGVKPDQRGH